MYVLHILELAQFLVKIDFFFSRQIHFKIFFLRIFFSVKRWHPLDPFSMIHDDLMPIYFTLKYICTTDSINECLKDYIIAFNDETKSKNQNLYEELFPNVMYLSRYSNYFGQHQLLCFRHSTVGKKYAFKRYDQFAQNTSWGFFEST